MAEIFCLRLPAQADGNYEYALTALGGSDGAQQGVVSSEQVAELAGNRRCVAVVSGFDVLITRVKLPTRSRARVAQALPYALEEQLTSDIEDLHFAIRRIDSDGGVHAAVVEHAAMQRWQAELAELGLDVSAIVPENGLLAAKEPHWQVIADGNQVVMALGGDGFALEPATAPITLEAALATAEQPPEAIEIEAPQGLLERFEAVPAAQPEPPPVKAQESDRPLFVRLAERLDLSRAVNLMQGPYAQRERWGWLWRPLRPAAALLGIWLLAQVVLQIVEVNQLAAEREELRNEIESVYRDTFPDGRVVNPRVQMQQHLRSIQGSGEQDNDEALLSRLLVQAAPALASDRLHLRSLRLRDGALEVELNTADIESLEMLRAALEDDSDLAVEIRSASAREGRVAGRLVIRQEAA
ncbi:general secretion pathway protein L [Halorhodospira halochloris]|uniref:Type II secretion system protein L n=1 Tax=Halorhodospira halochloris TaxID=1052 RepID=A0A0X8X6R5_HALHR|nr:type II secretion system protein GspL [Halorhodospira halochloris]MBK1650883.1 type II secretion system protein GspL [Halorhodospira halochloris]BAU56616.1 general secretion pathway protein L [Halorhodospira halochloris]